MTRITLVCWDRKVNLYKENRGGEKKRAGGQETKHKETGQEEEKGRQRCVAGVKINKIVDYLFKVVNVM